MAVSNARLLYVGKVVALRDITKMVEIEPPFPES
jgi:hypothetical protein